MRHVAVGVDIDASAAAVWDLIARFEHWQDWGTTIREVSVDAETVAPGVRGRVRTIVGIWLPFAITDVDDGRYWTWTVAGRPATGHEITPSDSATVRLDFTVVWPLLPYLLPMWLAVRRIRHLAEADGRGVI